MSIPNLTQSAHFKAAGTLSDCERCYAVHILPFAEARAEGQLQNLGFQTFQPKPHKTIRHARRLSTVEAPFFARVEEIGAALQRALDEGAAVLRAEALTRISQRG